MPILTSDPSTEVPGTLESDDWWLAEVDAPDTRSVVSVKAWQPTSPKETATFYPKGRDRAVVLHGDTYGAEGPLSVQALDEAEYDAVKALLQSDQVLLLRAPIGQQWYVEVNGDLDEQLLRAAPSDDEPYPIRFAYVLTAPLVETA